MNKDILELREMAKKLAEIAYNPENETMHKMWNANNSLRPVRPMVIIDQIPWHEMNIDDELTLKCTDPIMRKAEEDMRRTIYRVRHMRCDAPVDPFIRIPCAVEGYGYGIQAKVTRKKYDDLNTCAQAQHFDDILRCEEDLSQIHIGEISVNEEKQKMYDDVYHQIFDGILPMKSGGVLPSYQFWDWIVQWHTVEESLIDLVDRPEFIHAILKRLSDCALGLLEQLEGEGILQEYPSFIHCTPSDIDWSTKEGDGHVKGAKNSWTFAMSQIFSTVSPEMHEEFEYPYLRPIFEKFGHVYYGCCEPLHNKIDMIRKYPNVRKISMSPWADKNVGAERIGKDYVMSAKPNPAYLADVSLDEKSIERELRTVKEACRRNGTPLEFVLKDISTVRYEPGRLFRWAEIAMQIAQE